jgi:hypothetical protein
MKTKSLQYLGAARRRHDLEPRGDARHAHEGRSVHDRARRSEERGQGLHVRAIRRRSRRLRARLDDVGSRDPEAARAGRRPESGRRLELKAVLSAADFTGELKAAAEKLAAQAAPARRSAEPRTLDAVEADRARAAGDQGRRIHRALDRLR